MTQFKVLFYVDNEPTSLSGKIYENIREALNASELWQGYKNAVYEGIAAIQNVETGEIVSRNRMTQNAQRREELWSANDR